MNTENAVNNRKQLFIGYFNDSGKKKKIQKISKKYLRGSVNNGINICYMAFPSHRFVFSEARKLKF